MKFPIQAKQLLMLFPSMNNFLLLPGHFGEVVIVHAYRPECRLTDTSQELLDSWSVTVAQPVVVTVLMTTLMS